MSDLISRSALLDLFDAKAFDALGLFDGGMTRGTWLKAYKAVENAPAVDAEPVRHGRWEDIKGAIRCSECQEKPLYDYHGRLVLTRWCHACGVKMWKEIKSENH